VFDRYLARLLRALDDTAILEGGLVLELRLDRARTTQDIDLRLVGSSEGLLSRLREAGRVTPRKATGRPPGRPRGPRRTLLLVRSEPRESRRADPGPSMLWPGG